MSDAPYEDDTMKFRKKPVVIEAWRNIQGEDMPEWVQDAVVETDDDFVLIIGTMDGNMLAKHGDYIICGIKGEVYSCDSDIFQKTYEPVDTAAQ
jgi:hypothetical protein